MSHSPVPLLLTRDLRRHGPLPDLGPDASHRRIRPGILVSTTDWAAAFPEDRQRAAAEALLLESRGAPIVFSHHSAAAIHGLPLFRAPSARVHVIQTHAAAPSTSHVMRHRNAIDDTDVEWIVPGEIGVTSLPRTVFDMIRALRMEGAVSLADGGLRAVATVDQTRELDLEAAEALRQDVTERVTHASGARGIRQARAVIGFADARAESVGESVSRVYLSELGFPPPRLQVAVPGPAGTTYEVDFDLGTAWGEFDGEAKYTDPRFLRGRTPEQALADEKEREDWIRGTTGKTFGRWMMPHIPDAWTLGRRLAAFGIRPPRTRAPIGFPSAY